MTSLPKISQSDLEKLNCYLDDALSIKEKAEFEVKLARSLPLQSTLREYTILRNILRSVPRKRAPRHFTLTTAEAQQVKRPVLLAPIFSFASLVTVMLLAIVFAGDWIFKNMSVPVALGTLQAPMVSRASEPSIQSNETNATTDVPLIFNWGSEQVGYGMGGGAEMTKGMGGYAGSGLAFNPEVINPAVRNDAASLMTTESPSLSAEPTPEPAPTLAPAPLPADYAGAIIWGLLPASEGKIIDVYPTSTPNGQPQSDSIKNPIGSTSPEVPQTANAPYQTPTWVKYALAGLTLLFGLLAYFFSRRLN